MHRFVAGAQNLVMRPTADRRVSPSRHPAPRPLSEHELDDLQALLDKVPPPLEPLDVSMLDGFLCGVLLQPQRLSEARWLPHVTDVDGRPLPAGFDAAALHRLVRRRHAELDHAIAGRQWFDPWVFELEDAAPAAITDEDAPSAVEAVVPWVAGFAAAMELFPALMQHDAVALTEPLALLYRHLDPDDLEDADALLEEIESLEPPADLAEAVEDLVRATLLMADVVRPQSRPAQRAGPKPPPSRRSRFAPK
jgi:uncharacterized protein